MGYKGADEHLWCKQGTSGKKYPWKSYKYCMMQQKDIDAYNKVCKGAMAQSLLNGFLVV